MQNTIARPKRKPIRTRPGSRSGSAATETALMLPILLVVAFGAIEMANVVHLRQSLAVAAYEGARAVTKARAPQDRGDTRIREILSARGITDYQVTYTPPVDATTTRGTKIAVEVSIRSSNGLGPMQFFKGRDAVGRVVMDRL